MLWVDSSISQPQLKLKTPDRKVMPNKNGHNYSLVATPSRLLTHPFLEQF